MVKVIAVTGTPGTGKTTFAKRIARILGYRYIDVNVVIKQNKLSEGYDRKRRCKIIDTKRLNKAITDIAKKSDVGLVVDSHLSHYLPKKIVSTCIVTRCNLKKLQKRLVKRGYGKAKIRENLDSEIFEVCLTEAKENGHKIIEVFTDKKIDYEKIKRKIKN
jgi:broad-specificity NMP kinase